MRNTLGAPCGRGGGCSMARATESATASDRRWLVVSRVAALIVLFAGVLSIGLGVWRGWNWFYAPSFTGESSTGYGVVTNGGASRFGPISAILREPLTLLGALGMFAGLMILAYAAGALAQSEHPASRGVTAPSASATRDDGSLFETGE